MFPFLSLEGYLLGIIIKWADGKLHSLQKNNWLRIADFPLFRKLFWHLLCKM